MKNIFGLEKWVLDKDYTNSKRFADIKINLAYPFPNPEVLIDLKPKERIKQINKGFKRNLKSLLACDLIESWEPTGGEKTTRSIKAKVKFINLKKINKLDFIDSVWINSIDYATKIETEPVIVEKYFCVKMTVIIEIEGIVTKKQDIEKRYILIKAKSFDDAYEKIEKQQEAYAKPYLNPQGRFVRWRIDSFDDCYITDVEKPADINQPEGVEVFSALKSKKNKSKTIWNGKI